MGKTVLVIGGGVFGLSTALELAKYPDYKIKILDRSMPPVDGGTSVDMNRIMRADYADPVYAAMANDALVEWRKNPLFRDHYYQSGIVVVGDADNRYVNNSMQNTTDLGMRVSLVNTTDQLLEKFPSFEGELNGLNGYVNQDAGWTNAEGGIRAATAEAIRQGVEFTIGEDGTVTGFLMEGDQIKGAIAKSGMIHSADVVILAAGAWTPSLIDCEDQMIAVGQPVAYVQLDEAETIRYANNPVFLNLDTGFYSFPPTKGGILKFGRHGYGFTITKQTTWGNAVSTPPQEPIERIPLEPSKVLRKGLKKSHPKLDKKNFVKTRMCWYTDTVNGDFIFDYHPKWKNLFICAGGSGHGYKYLPILGKYTVGCMFGTLDRSFIEKFQWKNRKIHEGAKIDGSRCGPARQEFNLNLGSKL